MIRNIVFRGCSIILLVCLGCASEAQYIREGARLAGGGQNQKALESYFLALDENPESAPAHLGVAQVYLQTGRLDEAEQAIESATRIEPSDAATIVLADLRRQQKQYGAGAALLAKVLEQRPEEPELHYKLGLMQLDAGDVQRAAESFQTSVTLGPDEMTRHIELARALHRLERYQDAVDVLTEARKRFKGKRSTTIYSLLGTVYESMGMADYAERAFRQALKRSPEDGRSTAGVARSMRAAGDLPGAIEMLVAATTKNDRNVHIHLELGICYKEYRMGPQATAAFERVIELDPKLPETYGYLLPLLEKGSKDKKQRERLYKVLGHAAKALPENLDVQMQRGRGAMVRKRYDVAALAFKRAVEIDPSHVEANYTLGLAQLRGGREQAAIESYEALKYLDAQKADDLAQAIRAGPPADDSPEPKRQRRRKKGRGKKRRRR